MSKAMEELERWLDGKKLHNAVKIAQEGIKKVPVGYLGDGREEAMRIFSQPMPGRRCKRSRPTLPPPDFVQSKEHGHGWNTTPEALAGPVTNRRELREYGKMMVAKGGTSRATVAARLPGSSHVAGDAPAQAQEEVVAGA